MMNAVSIDLLKVLGGFGLFLYALRTLTQVLHHSLSRRMRGALSQSLSSPLRCFLVGMVATALVQASSITVMASLGLAGATLINLEQGFFLILGASLGTTLKVWFVGAEILKAGPILVGVGSISMLFVRRPHYRELLEGMVAVGFALWGMLLLKEGLELLHLQQEVKDWFLAHPGDRIYHQFLGICLGAALAAVLQSSSTVVFLVISLASSGVVPFPQAAAMVLGANIGTTCVPFLASIEHASAMRRLALAYVVIKVVGVGITLFFFPQFLQVVVATLPYDWSVGLHLAAVHTGFNLINVLWWSLFSGLILRWVERALPVVDASTGGLAPIVRLILSRSAARSFEEALRQLNQVTLSVKSMLDRCGSLLSGQLSTPGQFETRVMEQREFENLKDSTYELLTQAGRVGGGAVVDPGEIRRRLNELSYFEEMFYAAWRLREQLEFGLIREGMDLPEDLRPWLGRFQRAVDEYWLCLLFPDQASPPGEESEGFLTSLEGHYFDHLRRGGPDWESSVWVFDVLNGIREIMRRLGSTNPG